MFSELITAVKNGGEAEFSALCDSYRPLLLSMTDKYFPRLRELISDRDDLLQEATLAFYRAVLTFDTDQDEVTFGLYAKICINNRMISLLRRARRRPHKTSLRENRERSRIDTFSLGLSELTAAAERALSKRERRVFFLYAEGKSYADIASLLGITEKSVDNALFRAKTKLRRELKQFNMP